MATRTVFLARLAMLPLVLVCAVAARAQALPPASRAGNLQIGLGLTSANPDYEYVPNRIVGLMLYADFDFRGHLGAEFSFHQLKDSHSDVYQRSYEAGARYRWHFGAMTPYAKGMIGRGVLNFPKNDANLAYNLVAGGAGLDVAVRSNVNVRAEFEYQDWLSAPGPGLNITPSMFTVGLAYHLPAGKPR